MKKFGKKLFSVLLIATMMFSLTACGGKDGALKDGSYNAASEMTDYGYEEVEVTVKDGKISDVVLKRMNPDETEVDYDEWDGTSEDGKPNLKEAREEVANAIVEKQSTDVDNVAGATSSVDKWKELVDEALKEAK